jgi:3-isopropylmalate/(R)-2-methylmalate dehydratase large subunit
MSGWSGRQGDNNMGQTMTEQMFSRKSGKRVQAGEIVNLPVDAIMIHDLNAPHVLEVLQQVEETLGADAFLARIKGHSPKVLGVIDHLWPPPTIDSAASQDNFRKSGSRCGFTMAPFGEGICHHLMLEMGFVEPGGVIVGTDSHSCTYGVFNAFGTGIGASETAAALVTGKCWFKIPKATLVRFSGKRPAWVTAKDAVLALIKELTVDGCLYQVVEFGPDNLEQFTLDARITLCNMAVEMGAKSAVMPVDSILAEHLSKQGISLKNGAQFDPDAAYERVVDVNLEALSPLVAVPPNFREICEAGALAGTKVDQVVIGGCTNGRLDDMEATCRIFANGPVPPPHVRLLISPATRSVLTEMTRRGMTETFLRSGATILPPGCGPCSGFHLGVAGDGQTIVSTTNRNGAGRMGSGHAAIYLTSPLTAAASAICGEITDPRKFESR